MVFRIFGTRDYLRIKYVYTFFLPRQVQPVDRSGDSIRTSLSYLGAVWLLLLKTAGKSTLSTFK